MHHFELHPLATKYLTQRLSPSILFIEQQNNESNEQEKYIISQGCRESAMVKTDTSAIMEWACQLKSEHFSGYASSKKN